MIMSRRTTTLIAAVWACLLQLVSAQSNNNPCHICGGAGNSAMAYPNVVLSNVGKTCNQIALEIAMSTTNGSSQCSSAQNEWRNRCCSGSRPSGTDSSSGGLPPQNVPNVQYVGPHPVCKVCRDGDYPYATSMVINFLYIGEGSCAQYYRYGLEGRIATHMCDPVKFFAYEPCGCGEFNPYFNPNHPLANQAQQAPETNTGSTGGSTTGGSSSGGGTVQQQRQPDNSNGNKDASKMSNGYGGSGGGQNMRRLKGANRPKMAQH